MTDTKIEPHKITRPFQLLATWIAGLILLVGAFISAAVCITNPPWLRVTFGITAVAIVPLFIFLIFMMQTKYRAQLLGDSYYAEYLKQQNNTFKGFNAENTTKTTTKEKLTGRDNGSWKECEHRRIQIYEQNKGIFLIHTWRISHTPGQLADIAISLCQHGDGPLTQGKVESVEYQLGPKFFDHPVIKKNARDSFRLDVSAYGPMLCLARVNFSDDSPSLTLERYINF
ncbi:MAG: hypothetical protein PHY28_08970 [Dehalococcoidales bacterium]|nr:hypothetical protein [Dehalococcoidales bacterium]